MLGGRGLLDFVGAAVTFDNLFRISLLNCRHVASLVSAASPQAQKRKDTEEHNDRRTRNAEAVKVAGDPINKSANMREAGIEADILISFTTLVRPVRPLEECGLSLLPCVRPGVQGVFGPIDAVDTEQKGTLGSQY